MIDNKVKYNRQLHPGHHPFSLGYPALFPPMMLGGGGVKSVILHCYSCASSLLAFAVYLLSLVEDGQWV